MFIDKESKTIYVHRDEYDEDIKETAHFNFRLGATLGTFIVLVFWILYELQ